MFVVAIEIPPPSATLRVRMTSNKNVEVWMATSATRVKPEQVRDQKSGIGLVVGVSLATVFAVIITLLNVAKQGNVFNETNMLSTALIFFLGSAALYIAYGVGGLESHVKSASLLCILGLLATTGAAGHRWYVAG